MATEQSKCLEVCRKFVAHRRSLLGKPPLARKDLTREAREVWAEIIYRIRLSRVNASFA